MVFGAGYWMFTAMLLRRRFSRFPKEPGSSHDFPSATFFRPVKPGVPGLRDKASRLIACARPGDRVLFGVGCREDQAECEAACAGAVAGVEARVVLCEPAGGSAGENALSFPQNPKIAKLMALAAHAERENGEFREEPGSGSGSDSGLGAGLRGPSRALDHWIVTDSEALPDRRFMDAFRNEWARSKTAALTAGYRFVGASNRPQQLDHFPALLTLWPGLAAAEWGLPSKLNGAGKPGGLGFTLGACTAIRRADLATVGGWEAFAPYLAEDHQLGAALAAAGLRVRLSQEVLTLDSDPIGWRDWLRHQHRVSLTYRVCNPAGALGMGLTHGVTWAFLLALLHPGSPVCGGLLAVVLWTRIATARKNSRQLGFFIEPSRVSFAVLTVAASLAETLFWLVAWLPLPVRWGSRSFRMGPGGRFSAGKNR